LRYIDLNDRLDYEIGADDLQYGIRNIAGIYMGDNVRGFCSYKRKGYSYRINDIDYEWSNGANDND